MEFDPEFLHGQLQSPNVSTFFSNNPTSPQPNNPLVQPNDTTSVMNAFDHSQSFDYIPVFASPFYGDSTHCSGQHCFIEQIIPSNEQFIQDFIEPANINFTSKNINASSHDPQNSILNTVSTKLLPDFTEKITGIPTQFGSSAASSSHPPTPPPSVSNGGSGSMLKLKIDENLASLIKKNIRRANGSSQTSKRAKTQKDDKSSADTKGQWTSDEDRILKEFVDKHGEKKWSKIAKLLKNRIGKQCRERWYNHLQPNIKKGAWTLEEDIMLINAHKEFGNKWAKIAKKIPGRSENTVKNRWNTVKRSKNIKVHNNNIDEYDDSVLQAYIKDVTTSSTTSSKDKKATTSSKKKKKEEEKKNEDLIAINKDKGKAPMFSGLCNTDLGLALHMEFPTPDFGKEEFVVPTRAG